MIGSKESFAQCPICKNPYSLDFTNAPRILGSCGHSICTTCLLEILKHRQLKCPIDKRTQLLNLDSNRSNIELLYPKDFALIETLQELRAETISSPNPNELGLLSIFPDDHKAGGLVISSKFDLENCSNLFHVFREKSSNEKLSLTRVRSFNGVKFEVLYKIFSDKMVKDANLVLSKLEKGSIKSFELSLRGCHLKTDGAVFDITKQMSKMTSLQDLTMNFSWTPVKVNYLQKLKDNLSTSLNRLNTLKLVLNRSSLEKGLLKTFTSGISNGLTSVKKLTLCLFKAGITESDVSELSKSFNWLTTLESLKLVISSNLSLTDVSCLVLGLNKLTNLKSLKLNLVNTNITDQSLEHFSSITSLAGLSSFNINLSRNKIGDRSLKALSLLTKKMKKLQKFKLSLYGTAITDNGLNAICDSLGNVTKDFSVFCVSLGFTKIGDEGIKNLADTIGKTSQLKKLVMKLRNVRASKFDLILTKVSNLRKLQHLELWLNDTKVSDSVFKNFKVNQLKALEIFDLNLRNTNITDTSVCELCNSIEKLPQAGNMTSFFLNLSRTKTRAKGLKSLCNLLKKFKNLQNLTLSISHIKIRKRYANDLFQAIETFRGTLRLLELNLINTTVFDPDIEILVRLLRSNDTRLEWLVLELRATSITAPNIVKLLNAAKMCESIRFWKIK